MQLHEALQQISDIRVHMAQSAVFRGYRSMTVGFSGVLAIVAATLQPMWVASPQEHIGPYLSLWLAVAGVCVIVAGAELFARVRRQSAEGFEMARRQTLVALEQFLPCLVVGALLTLVIYRSAPQVAWMLPGLWSLLYGLGIFASIRMLPRQSVLAASYYTCCGCGCLLWGQGDYALSPWLMGVAFGGGQLLSAAILYWNLERTPRHDTTNE